MDGKQKDKVIIGLIIAVIILLANNIVGGKSNDFSPNRLSLMDVSSDLLIEEDSNTTEEDSDIINNSEMKVHISGEIANPGVYTITDGDRLDDLVKKAGGLTDIANERDLNLAMKLEDQMKVYVPSIYDEDLNENLSLVSLTSSESEANKININTASKEELMTLPNIGDKRAQAIIDYREAELFKDIEDIKNVTGIGDKFYEAMKDLITV